MPTDQADPGQQEVGPTPQDDVVAEGPRVRGLSLLTRLSAAVLPPVLWLLAALYQYSGFIRHPSRGVPGGPDGILYAWYFQSVSHSLTHGLSPFITASMNAPTGLNLMWNTSVILPAVILTPLTAAFGGLFVVGWLMVLSPVLSACSAYAVLRTLSGQVAMPLLLATLYGYGPFVAGQAGHLHLILAAPLVPVVVLLVHRLLFRFDARAWVSGVWLGVTVTVMMLISEEIVAMTAIVGAVAIIVGAVVYPRTARDAWQHAGRGLAVGIGVSVALLGIPLAYQFKGPLALHGGVTLNNLPLDLAGTVRPSYLQYFADTPSIRLNHTFRANGIENTGYLGIPLLLLLIAVAAWLIYRHDRFILWWAVIATTVFVMSLGSPLWVNGRRTAHRLPWEWVRRLPLLSSMITVRFTLFLLLLIILLLLYVSTQVTRPWRHRVTVAVIGLALLPLLPAHGGSYREITKVTTPRFFSTRAVDAIPAGATVLVLPISRNPGVSATAMYWQIRAKMRFKLVGGYSVFNSGGHNTYHGHLPPLAMTLMATATSGRAPTTASIDLTHTAAGTGSIQWIVLTNGVKHHDAVARAMAALGDCTVRPVSDVLLCRLGVSD